MRRALRPLLACLLLAVFAGLATAADAPARPEGAYTPGEPLPVERLPVNGALSQNSITSMLQDRTGQMWFATLGGVNVYDGYTFRAITSDPRDPDSLSGVLVSRLFEDRDGFIWVAGFHGWLDRIDPLTGKVRHFARSLYGRTNQPPGFGPVGIHQS